MEEGAHPYSHALIGIAIGLLVGTCIGYLVGTWQMMQGYQNLEITSPAPVSEPPLIPEPTPSPAVSPQPTSTTSTATTTHNPSQNVRTNPFN